MESLFPSPLSPWRAVLLASIGSFACLAGRTVALPPQSRGQLGGTGQSKELRAYRNWLLDERGLAVGLPALPSADALRRSGARKELWQRSKRYGPRLGPLVAKAGHGRDAAGLSCLAALGLLGGPSASKILTQVLEAEHRVELRVLAALAAARSNVDVAPKLLRRLAFDGKRSEVLRYAARVALLLRGEGRQFGRAFAGMRNRPSELRLWFSLQRALDAKAATRVVEAPKTIPPGSLEELSVRALLLDAIRHPGVLTESDLLDLLRVGEARVVQQLASLALARLPDGNYAKWLRASPALQRDYFFAGLEHLPRDLLETLARGPGGGRDLGHRMRFRAAAARLLPAEKLNSMLATLLGTDGGAASVESAEAAPAIKALLLRALSGSWEPDMPQGLRARLREFYGREGLLLALYAARSSAASGTKLLHTDAQLSEDEVKRLGVRLATAYRLFRQGRLGRNHESGARILWQQFEADERFVVDAGPGSSEALFVAELASLIHDLFVGPRKGSRKLDRTIASSRRAHFLPAGIRPVRRAYWVVLSEYLEEWPLPRRIPYAR